MKFELQIFGGPGGSSNKLVTVSHGEEHDLSFQTQGYASARSGDNSLSDEDFHEINRFIAKLPADQQYELYQSYQRIEGLFYLHSNDGSITTAELESHLKDECKRIYDIVRFDDLENYVRLTTSIKLPPELADDYSAVDRITPKSMKQTYLKDEYIKLLAAVLGLRLMIPIWGKYLVICKATDGTDLKEYVAFRLLKDTDLMASGVFERLEQYLEANIETNRKTASSVVFKFLTSDEIPGYLVALTAIRKLSIAPLGGDSERQHLNKIIFNFAVNRHDQLPVNLKTNIDEKVRHTEKEEGDNSSVWCIYKMKEQMATGDLEIFQTYINNYHGVHERIEPNYSRELLEALVKKNLSMVDFYSTDAQKTLAAWVLSTVISANTLWMFDRQTLMIALAIAQSVLYHWGYTELAILITAQPHKSEEDEDVIRVKPPMAPIDPGRVDTIYAICPFQLEPDQNSLGGNLTNPALRDIEYLVNEFAKTEWSQNVPAEISRQFNRLDVVKTWAVSLDLRDQLAKLFIQIDEFVDL